ncbi:MAG: DUF1801 domain-containing protein [Nocardioides sp.]
MTTLVGCPADARTWDMANKTVPTDASVDEFLAGVDDQRRRDESYLLIELAREVTGEEPVMWGSSIIGFGHFTMTYDTGREVEWMRFGFSPRKAQLVLYAGAGASELTAILDRLGPHKTGQSCIYLKRLDGLDRTALANLITAAVAGVDAMRGAT